MSIEAMKQALEALQRCGYHKLQPDSIQNIVNHYIPLLEQAITTEESSAVQEPVAKYKGQTLVGPMVDIYEDIPVGASLYTHSQPKAEQEPAIDNQDLTIAYMSGFHDGKKAQPKREPLTLEQLREHWQVARVLDMTDAEIDFADYVLIARDVEALHGIKGEA